MAKSCDKDNSCVEEENAWDYLPEEEVRTVKPLHQRLDYLQEEEVPTVKPLHQRLTNHSPIHFSDSAWR